MFEMRETLKHTRGIVCCALCVGLHTSMAVCQTFAYVTNRDSETVSVIDTASNSVIDTVGVGESPLGIAITPDGSRAFVVNQSSDTLSVIDTSTNTVVDTVAVGDNPFFLSITPDGTRAYITNRGSDTVSVIDTTGNMVIATVSVGDRPNRVAITPDGGRAYVTNSGPSNTFSGTVSVIDTNTNTVVATVAVGGSPTGVAITPDGTRAYVADRFTTSASLAGLIHVIDTNPSSEDFNTVVGSISVQFVPQDVAVTPDGAHAYVANRDSDSVSVINTDPTSENFNTVVATVTVGSGPVGTVVTPDGALVYVANAFSSNVSGSVSVIETTSNTVIGTVAVEGGPIGVAVMSPSDSDGDGLPDTVETNTGVFVSELDTGTDPLNPDTDGDGLDDGTEVDVAEGTGCPDPLNPDSDGDNILDGVEVDTGTDPCNPDTDNDGIPDDIDPFPLDPGGTPGFIELELRDLAVFVDALDPDLELGLIDAPNDNAAKGRRNAMSNKLTSAANAVAAGGVDGAIDQLLSLLAKLDGNPQPKDWMTESDERDVLVLEIETLIILLEFL